MKCYIFTYKREDLENRPREELQELLVDQKCYRYECQYCDTVKVCNQIREQNADLIKRILIPG